MFNSLEEFSISYFSGLALLLLGIIFEDKLVKAEIRLRKKYLKNRKVRARK